MLLGIALHPCALAGDQEAVAGIEAVFDSGGGPASGGGARLVAGSLGGSFQSGPMSGGGYRFEGGWIGPASSGGGAVTGDFNGDAHVTFSDFLILAAGYGKSEGDAGFDPLLDLDANGSVDFGDFVIFAAAFGS